MGIANIGSFAGGLMRGHLAATEEQRRAEDQAFQNEQRGIWREDQARLKRIREGIAGIARPGQETSRTPFVMDGIDGPEQLPGAYNVTRQTGEGFQRGLADLYYREGAPELGAAAEDRIQTLSDRARTNRLNERTDRQTAAVDAALLKRADMLKELATDEDAFVAKYGDLFNRDEFGGPQHKGARLAFASTPQGKVGYYIGADGTVGGQFPVNRQSLMEIVNQLTDADLSAASPEQFNAAQTRGIQRGQLSAQQTTANAAMRNAATQEDWRRHLEGKPTLTPDGSGRILVTDNQGNLLRTLGSPKPDPNARNAQFRDPVAYDAAVKEYNALAAQYQAAETPVQRQDLARKMSVVEVKIANAMGKPMQVKPPAEGKDLTFVKTENGGYFADPQGVPRAQFDAQGQFPMIPFGVDPRADKKWPAMQEKLGEAGASLAVAVNANGQHQWAFKSKDGRMWSTPQEAVKPPEIKQDPSGANKGGTATKEPMPAPTTTSEKTAGLQRPNPYVNTKGERTGARVSGDDKSVLDRAVVPAVKDAAKAVGDRMSSAGNMYLQQKIDSGVALTPMEQAQARRAGLIK